MDPTSRAAAFSASKQRGRGARRISVQVVRPPIRMSRPLNEIPLNSAMPEMSMTGLGNGRSPRAGKKSVPPDRIWAPWRERVSTASSSVVGLKYKPLVPHRQSGARTADDWLSVHSHTNAASLYRSVLGRAFSPHRHRGHRGRSIGFSRLPTPVRYGVSRRASFNRNARDRPAFERFQIADHAHHSTTLCASVVTMGSCLLV